jgi:hypothetical protein
MKTVVVTHISVEALIRLSRLGYQVMFLGWGMESAKKLTNH